MHFILTEYTEDKDWYNVIVIYYEDKKKYIQDIYICIYI